MSLIVIAQFSWGGYERSKEVGVECETYDRDKSAGDGEKDLVGGIVRVENDARRWERGILVWWYRGMFC